MKDKRLSQLLTLHQRSLNCWAANRRRNEKPTTDTNFYKDEEIMMPFGGYKASRLAIMVESLAGIFSGAALLKDVHAWNTDPENNGYGG